MKWLTVFIFLLLSRGLAEDIQLSLQYYYAGATRPVADVQAEILTLSGQPVLSLRSDADGRINSVLDTRVDDHVLPKQYALQTYPNPFRHTVQAAVTARHPQELYIYNVLGQQVFSTKVASGSHRFTLDFAGMPAGLYFMKSGASVHKMLYQGGTGVPVISMQTHSQQAPSRLQKSHAWTYLLVSSHPLFATRTDTLTIDGGSLSKTIALNRVYAGPQVFSALEDHPIDLNFGTYFADADSLFVAPPEGFHIVAGNLAAIQTNFYGTITVPIIAHFAEAIKSFNIQATWTRQTDISGTAMDPVLDEPVSNIIIYGPNGAPIDTTDANGKFNAQIGSGRIITLGDWNTNVPGRQPMRQSVSDQSDIDLDTIVVSQLSPQQYLSFKSFLDVDDDFWVRLETDPNAKAWTVGYDSSMYDAKTGIFNNFAYVGIRDNMVEELTRQVVSMNNSLKQIGSFVQFPMPDSSNLVPYLDGDETATIIALYNQKNFVNEKTGEPVKMWWMSSERGTIPSVYVNAKQRPEGPHFITSAGIFVNYFLLDNVDYEEGMSMATGFRGEDNDNYHDTFMGGGGSVTKPTQKDIYAGHELFAEEIFNKTNIKINETSGVGTELQRDFILYKTK